MAAFYRDVWGFETGWNGTTENNMKSMKEQAQKILKRCKVVTLTSVHKDGYPRPVPRSEIYAESFDGI